MIKKIFLIILSFIILMSVLTNYPKILRFLKFNFFKNDNFENTNFEKKLIKCNLVNEIIDRQIKDNERQCYYSCSEDDEVRVDTSIEYPCQPYIMEER